MSKRVKQNTNRFYEGVRVVARVLLCVFFRITYVGLEHIPTDQGYLLCSNHRSYLDAFFIGYKIPVALRFVAKDDLFRFRPLRWFITKMGAFPIKRGTKDEKAFDTAGEILRGGGALVIFPEGTRSLDGKLLAFKAGAALMAAQTGSDVLPVGLSWKGRLRPFKKITVRYGPLLTNERLGLTDVSRQKLKAATGLIAQAVGSLVDPQPTDTAAADAGE